MKVISIVRAAKIEDWHNARWLLTYRKIVIFCQLFLYSNSSFSSFFWAMLHHFLLPDAGRVSVKTGLAYLFILSLDNESPFECMGMIYIKEQGKTTQLDWKELGVCNWNMHYTICPLCALAFYFFTCWHLDLEWQPPLSPSWIVQS